MNEKETIKAVLLGETYVSKTCIINRLKNNGIYENILATNGADYCSKTIKFQDLEQTINLDIWDSSRIEKYAGLIKCFITDAKVIVFVYDITNKYSFESIKDYWYEKVIMYSSSETKLILVGNKLIFMKIKKLIIMMEKYLLIK